MKKQILLLAGSAIIFASCGSNNNTPTGPTQAQQDSMMNAKLAEHDAANAAKNDSTLKAIEAEKAAAMSKEHEHEKTGGKKHEGGKKTEPAATPAPPPPPPPATTAQDDKFKQRSGNQPQGQSKSAEAQKAQDDKFNRRGGH